ncbi:MAG TPA: hypothetical protein DCZ92_00450 [Elusimicrobia bacterium]|nr:hypothetical protein [Elusimicrobiota bacterium]
MQEERPGKTTGDFDLLKDFNSGSEEAFTRIVEKHSGPLINFLHRYTQSQSTSEDIAQEAFLRLYKAAPDLKPDAKLSTIIYKIAYNVAVDYARRNKSRSDKAPTHSLDAAAADCPDPAAGSNDNPDSIYETRQQNKEIAAMLADLPDTQHLAIILKAYEDRSYAEIAEIMGLSVSSVDSLIFRARQSLAKKLK